MSKKLDINGISLVNIPVRSAIFIVLTSLATSISSKPFTLFQTPRTTISLMNISVFLLPYPAPSNSIKAFRKRVRSVYKELHADHETGAADNK